jgi:hypothetical protein
MTAMNRANTLAFVLIGKDGPHRIIKICFGNMNLVFGSEFVLLGFWEYMFGILVTMCYWQTCLSLLMLLLVPNALPNISAAVGSTIAGVVA